MERRQIRSLEDNAGAEHVHACARLCSRVKRLCGTVLVKPGTDEQAFGLQIVGCK